MTAKMVTLASISTGLVLLLIAAVGAVSAAPAVASSGPSPSPTPQPSPRPAAVSPLTASSSNTVVAQAGTVWAWGYTPAQVSGLSGVVGVSAGDFHNLALKSDGTVWAWGVNNYGQLGDGTTTDRNTPAQVPGLSGIVAVTAYDYSSLALKSDGTVWAWGSNGNGELGDGTYDTNPHPTPVQVPGLSGIVAVTAGDYYSMAIDSGGHVWAWGWNQYGELGDGTTTNRYTPIQVPGLSGVVAVAAGWSHSLAVKSDGTIWAWGSNGYGELGSGTYDTNPHPTPVQVSGLSGIVAITAGDYYSLALKSNGTVWAWGINNYGQLGNGTYDTNPHPTPAQVSGLSGIVAVAPTGDFHNLAIKSDGTVWAWGWNQYGQLGDGTTTNRYTPIQVPGLSGVVAVAANYVQSLAVVGSSAPPTGNVDLAVTTSASPNPTTVFKGYITYTIVVRNNGASPATNVALTDNLPTGSALSTASSSQGSCNRSSPVTCNLGTIAGGASATVTIIVVPKVTRTATNIATVTASEPDSNPSNNTSTSSTTVNCLVLDGGLSSCELQEGDILLLHNTVDPVFALETALFAGYWSHAGIYNGDGTVTESRGGLNFNALPGVEKRALWASSWAENPDDWAILRVKSNLDPDGQIRHDAVIYARNQAGKHYNWNYPDPWTESVFYCSQLVWRAYQKWGVNIDSNLSGLKYATVWNGPWGQVTGSLISDAIPPDDIYYADSLHMVDQRPLSGVRVILRLLSPADLLVTDPQGRRAGIDPVTGQILNEIPGTFYGGPNDEPEFMSISDLTGTWRVDVVGKGEGSYTFQAETVDRDNHVVAMDSNLIQPGAVATYELSNAGGDKPLTLTRVVKVDIRPGDATNPVNLGSKGTIPVAILSTATFDATVVDPLTVRFGPSGASAMDGRGQVEDVNCDGKPDMLFHFATDQTGIAAGDTQACLIGKTKSGLDIRGCDTVRIVPPTRTADAAAGRISASAATASPLTATASPTPMAASSLTAAGTVKPTMAPASTPVPTSTATSTQAPMPSNTPTVSPTATSAPTSPPSPSATPTSTAPKTPTAAGTPAPAGG